MNTLSSRDIVAVLKEAEGETYGCADRGTGRAYAASSSRRRRPPKAHAVAGVSVLGRNQQLLARRPRQCARCLSCKAARPSAPARSLAAAPCARRCPPRCTARAVEHSTRGGACASPRWARRPTWQSFASRWHVARTTAAQRWPRTPLRVQRRADAQHLPPTPGHPGVRRRADSAGTCPGCRTSTRAPAARVLNAVSFRAAGHWHRRRPATRCEPRAWRHRRRRAGAPLWTRGGSLSTLRLTRCAFCAQTRTEALGLLLGALCFALPTIGERLEEVSTATPLRKLHCTVADAVSPGQRRRARKCRTR